MEKEKVYYFYLWQHKYTGMTCYGITNNPDRRRSEYEGHNGFDIQFSFLISGSESVIKQLEESLKQNIRKLGYNYRGYEWIDSAVNYNTIVSTVFYLLGDREHTVEIKEGND